MLAASRQYSSENDDVEISFSPLFVEGGTAPDLTLANRTAEGGTSSVLGACFNFANSIIGAGIIGIPYALMQCGFVLGILLLVSVAIIVYFSVVMMIDCGIRAQKYDLETLSRQLLGDRGYYLALFVMFIFGYGAQVAYLVIIGDTLPPVFDQFLGDTILSNRTFVMVLLAIFVILPLCLWRDLSALSWTSMLSVISDIAIVSIVILFSSSESKKQGTGLQLDSMPLYSSGVFAGIGAMSFAFVCQHNSFLVFKSLTIPSLDNWKYVASRSILFAFTLSLCLGLIGYLSFGTSTQGDLLNNFPSDHLPACFARLFLAVCMVFTFPLECFVARHCMFQIYHKLRSNSSSMFAFFQGSEFSGLSSDSTHSTTGLALNESESSTQEPSVILNDGHGHIDEATALEHITITLILWGSSLFIALAAHNLGVVLTITGQKNVPYFISYLVVVLAIFKQHWLCDI